jgi:hypothetical protein
MISDQFVVFVPIVSVIIIFFIIVYILSNIKESFHGTGPDIFLPDNEHSSSNVFKLAPLYRKITLPVI